MFDAKKLLDQVMSSAQRGDFSDLQRQAQAMLGGGSGATPGRPSVPSIGGGSGGLVQGALAGGVVGLLLGNKKARKFAGGAAGTALKLGGLAAVAAIAYKAWQSRQGTQPAPAAGTSAASAPAQPQALLPPPADSPFAPQNAPGGEQGLARGVLVAMIQGAKADGHIDAAEQQRIFAHVQSLDLDAEAKAFVMDELASPLDVEKVARHAATPETAVELYAASLLAMDPDAPSERAYLDRLAARLALDPSLAAEIERSVKDAL